MSSENIQRVLKTMLLTVPGLPDFVPAAVSREVQLRVHVWQGLDELLGSGLTDDESANLPDLFCGAPKHVMPGLLAFAATCAGMHIYIPRKADEDHIVYKSAGPIAAAYICDVFSGLAMLVPSCDVIFRILRNRAIVRDYKAGMAVNKISEKYAVAYCWVVQLLGKANINPSVPHKASPIMLNI